VEKYLEAKLKRTKIGIRDIELRYFKGIAGLDCRIAKSGLQSNLVDWIVITNPKTCIEQQPGYFIIILNSLNKNNIKINV
jgi:hypothetical protein